MTEEKQESASKRFQHGFTLVELLVSMTLLAMILGLLAGGLRIISRSWEDNTRKIDKLDMILRAYDILRRDIEGLRRVTISSGEQSIYIFVGQPKTLAFVVIEPPYPTRPGPYFVRYSVSGSARSATLIRARARYQKGITTFPGATPSNKVRILQGNLQLQFSFAENHAGKSKWHARWPYKTRLPDLVRLQIRDVDAAGYHVPSMVIRVRADAELSCTLPQATLCSPKTNGELRQIARRQDQVNGDQKHE